MDHIDTTDQWQGPFVLASNEYWQCDRGVVEIATGDAPDHNMGFKLLGERLDAIPLGVGVAVFCRTRNGGVGRIIRMPVATGAN